jgi:hypothetical protein
LLRQEKRVIYLDAEVAHGAFQLRMAQEELAGAQIAGALIDQRDLRSAKAVRSIKCRVQSDRSHPVVEKAAVKSAAAPYSVGTTRPPIRR